jgi:outer membrane protein TolC
MDRRRFAIGLLATLGACMPGTPRIDGAPAAPPAPSALWPVPQAAKEPPPPATIPVAPEATAALRGDTSDYEGQRLELDDVVDLALRKNPATRESWLNARAAADAYGSSRGALLPNLDASVTTGRTSSAPGSIASLGSGTGNEIGTRNAASGSRSQLTTSATLSYLLFDLGGRSGSIEEARQRAVAADLTHNATVHDVILQVESALFSYLATRALREAQEESVREAVADTAAAAERMHVGVATLAEVLQARTQLAQGRLQLATLQGQEITTKGNLATAMGLPANARYEVANVQASDTVARIAASVDSLVNAAIVNRPEIAEVRAEAASLAAAVRVARSAGYPALTLSSTTSSIQSSQTGVSPRNAQLFLGLQIPIFNGFSRQYDLRAAREQYDAGLARLASTRQQVAGEVFAAYSALTTANDRVRSAHELLMAAQQSADVALGRYREGVGTIVDLLLARSALATARAEDIQARWEWRTALAQLAHDTGLLTTTGRTQLPLSNEGSNDRR